MKPYIIAIAVALASAVLIWTAIHPSAPAGVAGEQFEPLLKENGAELIEIGPQVQKTINGRDYVAFKGLVKRQWFGMKPTMVIGFLTDVKERTVSFMPIETLERFLETGDDSQLPKRPDLTFH